MTAIIFILVLSLLVFVHEFGHFIVAKRVGAKVEEFGFGFPPRVWGIKRGDTTYSINWIPLGGFVKIKGEDGGGREEKDSFASKSIVARVGIILAGVTMNIVLAFVLLTIGAGIGSPQAIAEADKFAKIENEQIQIVSILPGSPAERAGLEAGDMVVSVDGKDWKDVEALRDYISGRESIDLQIKRYDEAIQKTVPTEFLQVAERKGVGIGLLRVGTVRYPWYLAPWKGLTGTLYYIKEIAFAFGRLISDLVLGHTVSVALAGPVGIAALTGQMARMGIVYLLQFVALLSINLAFINVFPFPALDGGRGLFLAIEALRGRPVSQKVEAVIHNIGFILLITLVLIITYRDIAKYSGTFFSKLGG